MSTLVESGAPQEGINGDNSVISEAHLLRGGKRAPGLLSHLAWELEHSGIPSNTSPPDEVLHVISTNSRVIAFLEDENLLLDADERRLDLVKHLARNTARVCIVSRYISAKHLYQ